MRIPALAVLLLTLSLGGVTSARQDPANGPIRAKQAFKAAQVEAAAWDPSAYFAGFETQPSADKDYDSGKLLGWTFQFYSRKKCPTGKMRMLMLQAQADNPRIDPQKKINGLGVNHVQEGELNPPFPAPLIEDWMDSDRAFGGFKKNGFPNARTIKTFEVRWYFGKVLWRGVSQEGKSVFLETPAKVAAEGEDAEKTILATYAKPKTYQEVETALRKDVAIWPDAGEAKLVIFDGLALDATEFVKSPKIQRALAEFYLTKPTLKRYFVRIINDRVEYYKASADEDPIKKEAQKLRAWTFKGFDEKKFKAAIDANDKIKEWLDKAPKAGVRVQTLDAGKLQITFESDENRILQYDPESGVLD